MEIRFFSQRSKNIARTFFWLVRRDLHVTLPLMPARIVSVIFWSVIYIYIFEYVGLSALTGYGVFVASSECVSRAYRRTFPAVRIVGDLLGEKSLLYYLTLPLPQWMVFAALSISISCELMCLYVWVLPVAKLLMWNTFHLSLLGMVKAGCVFVCAHLVYGTTILLLASMRARSIEDIAVAQARYIDPLFWIGAYFFTWSLAYSRNKLFGVLLLANPLVYACEGMRSALFNKPESLPVWLCCGMLLFFTVAIGYTAVQRMKHKLDCVR